ncbi:L-gulonolactone oxidase 5-like isoform X2 [Bradysia coprophila]|uniref:L-gulonolactone oxidase 5-like isoform X2 n=1 Tax=Bradysia coprophila TaxID=38358 RepID=UPI00187D7665|nr:L-gulonolactone oxidase 5-like isoform X2 [Bradysia coprophila]
MIMNLNKVESVFVLSIVTLNSLFRYVHGITIYTSYQSEIACYATYPIEYPATIEEVQRLVLKAIAANSTVKAFGARHSVLDTICTNGTPIDMRNINYVDVDTNANIVKAGAGAQLADFVAKLQENGKALYGQVPSFGGVTIGGALGTGARGSSLMHHTSLSDQLIAVKVVDGFGNIQVIDESKPDDLSAFKVHLGLLGVIVEASFRTCASYKMHVYNYQVKDDILFDNSAIRMATEKDWFQMWWFPNTKSVIVSEGIYINNDALGNASTYNIPEIDQLTAEIINNAFELGQTTRSGIVLGALELWSKLSLHKQVPLRQPIFSQDGGISITNPATGYVHGLMQNKCKKCGWDYGPGRSVYVQEFAVGLDISKFKEAVSGIRNILSLDHATFPIYGIFIRFAPQSTAMMAVEFGQTTVHIEIVTPMRKNRFKESRYGLSTVQAIEQFLNQLGGRPHWSMSGQVFHTTSMAQKNYPNLSRFGAIIRKYDQNGVFLNKFGKRITGASRELTIDPRMEHCALQDDCFCNKNRDCATGQYCGELNGFKVCKDILSLKLINDVSDGALAIVGKLLST